MCWKQEWAMAINNINHAIEHTERAQKKLAARITRNQKTLEQLRNSPKYNYPKVLAPIEGRIKKNMAGLEECRDIISALRAKQDLLYCMVHTYGIKHKEAPRRVYELMGKYPDKINCKQSDCEECPLVIQKNNPAFFSGVI